MKKHGYEHRGECREAFACAIFQKRKVEEWIPAADNLRQIRRTGMEKWLSGQIRRQELVEELLHAYNEGRSMSLYCAVGARMPIPMIREAMEDAESEIELRKGKKKDKKESAKIMKPVLQELAVANGIILK